MVASVIGPEAMKKVHTFLLVVQDEGGAGKEGGGEKEDGNQQGGEG